MSVGILLGGTFVESPELQNISYLGYNMTLIATIFDIPVESFMERVVSAYIAYRVT